MTVFIRHKSTNPASILKRLPNAQIIDVTSKGESPWVRFSPFYPLGDIPVPFSAGHTSQSVEGIWQALKVFEHCDIDPHKLTITDMKGLKRTVRSFGAVLGHRKGLHGNELFPYIEARRSIYLPTYRWALDHKLQKEVAALLDIMQHHDLVLLDYETNEDIDDPRKPLSHAGLIKRYLENTWPRSQQHPLAMSALSNSPLHWAYCIRPYKYGLR